MPETPEQAAARKIACLQAVTQLDMLIQMFANAPEYVKEDAKKFRDSLEKWSNA